MSISVKLRAYLDRNNIKFTLITHSRAYTPQGLASAINVSGKETARVVILKIDG